MKQKLKKLIPYSIQSIYYFLWAFLGAFIFRFPARSLIVVGITGTNGKTTTNHFLTDILAHSGHKVASISSVRFKIGDEEWPNRLKMTMPGRFKIQRFLRKAVNAGCTHAVLEVTSEGIVQQRHRFLNFSTAVLTNITPEHIERHGGFENYKKAKGELFKRCGKAHIVNLDDANAEYFLRFETREKWGFSEGAIKNLSTRSTFHVSRFTSSVGTIRFNVGETPFSVSVLGDFNFYNALAAVTTCMSLGVDLATCARALGESRGVPGRMEIVSKNPLVVVDYAHTPDALEKVYKTLQSSGRKLVCVLGAAGGGRDKWKRPELGKIAAQYCGEIILTDEDPYDEDPGQILSEIKSGIFPLRGISRSETNLYEILNRREAIRKAIGLAGVNDIVIITGKGSEPLMMTKRGPIPWDDREVARQALSEHDL